MNKCSSYIDVLFLRGQASTSWNAIGRNSFNFSIMAMTGVMRVTSTTMAVIMSNTCLMENNTKPNTKEKKIILTL